tara:strand:+ start:10746 stop:10970 length:225 start_codon:yes stop_codon:yes gene_type:complete
MSDNTNLKLSDEVIGQIAKLVQMAIISGTDVVDHFRQARLTVADDTIYLAEEYKSQFENNIEAMLEGIGEDEPN